MDCTKGQNHELCKQEGVEGYPTFNHYNYGKFVEKYNGERGVSGPSRKCVSPSVGLGCVWNAGACLFPSDQIIKTKGPNWLPVVT